MVLIEQLYYLLIKESARLIISIRAIGLRMELFYAIQIISRAYLLLLENNTVVKS